MQSQGVLNYLNTSMKHNGKQFKNMNINTVCNTTGVNNIVYVSRKIKGIENRLTPTPCFIAIFSNHTSRWQVIGQAVFLLQSGDATSLQ